MANKSLFQSTIGGTIGKFTALTNSTLTFNTYVDASNAAFGTATQVGTQTFSGKGVPFSSSAVANGLEGTLYSETIVATLTASAGSTTSPRCSATTSGGGSGASSCGVEAISASNSARR